VAEFHWKHRDGGWALEVVEARRGRPVRQVVTLFLPEDGSVPTTGTLL
jgi:hypothetical protein